MHLVIVSADHHPDHGGIGAAVALQVRAAVAAGWRVDLVSRGGSAHPAGARIHLVRTVDERPAFAARVPALRRIDRIRPYRYGLFAAAAARVLLTIDGRPDAVEFVDSRAEGIAALLSTRVRRRFRGVPMVVQAHTPMFIAEDVNGVDERRFGRRVYHRWERQALAVADGIITPSVRLAKTLGRPAAVIPHPVHVETVAAEPCAGARLLFVGTIDARKGVDVWARSLNEVLRRRPDAHAEIIGSDTMIGPGERSMARYAASLVHPSLRARLRFRGPLAHAETLSAIAGASVVVAPSRFESFGLAAAEAVALGRPVILSDRVGLTEYVRNLAPVPAGDAAALAAAQLAILRDRATADRRAARASADLRAACDPAVVLGRRAWFLQSLRCRDVLPRVGVDAIDRFDRYRRAVEAREATARNQVA